jgi:hypothetical protein
MCIQNVSSERLVPGVCECIICSYYSYCSYYSIRLFLYPGCAGQAACAHRAAPVPPVYVPHRLLAHTARGRPGGCRGSQGGPGKDPCPSVSGSEWNVLSRHYWMVKMILYLLDLLSVFNYNFSADNFCQIYAICNVSHSKYMVYTVLSLLLHQDGPLSCGSCAKHAAASLIIYLVSVS